LTGRNARQRKNQALNENRETEREISDRRVERLATFFKLRKVGRSANPNTSSEVVKVKVNDNLSLSRRSAAGLSS